MKTVLIYGASYPDTVKILSLDSDISIMGFIDDEKFGSEDFFQGYPILGDRSILKKLSKDVFVVNNVFATTKSRQKIYEFIKSNGFNMLNVIHPSVDHSMSKIGEGVWMNQGVCVGANSTIGNNVAVRFNSIINHDNVIYDHVFISPGVTLAGSVCIENNVFIGSGAVILPNVIVGRHSVIGAGSIVTRSIPSNSKVVGNPARVIK